MLRHVSTLIGACVLLPFVYPPSQGQATIQHAPTQVQAADVDKEPKVTFELGAATSWSFSGGPVTFAPNLAAESTLKENWVEIEVGVSPFYTHTAKEWDTDLLFKKPWTISRKAEFMLGLGPQWVHLKQNGTWSNSIAGEVAGDFMFWPTGKHHFGWYLEPAYDYSFARGHQKSIGISGGLLIGIP